MIHLFRKISTGNRLFSNSGYLDSKACFLYRFGRIPSVSYITKVDTTEAYQYINQHLQSRVLNVYQHSEFNHEDKKLFFNVTILVLKSRRMIELGSDYVALFHGRRDYKWTCELLEALSAFRIAEETKQHIGFARSQATN